MTERNPHSNSAEREADYSTYAGIAGHFFDTYVGDAVPANVEDVDAWRTQTRHEVADHMATIARDLPRDEREKAFTEIIEGLKELRSYTGAEAVNESEVAVATEADAASETESREPLTLREKARLAKANAEIAIRSNPQYLSLPGVLKFAKNKLSRAAEKATPRKEGESDEAYERRVRRRGVGLAIGGVAVAAALLLVTREASGTDPAEIIAADINGSEAGDAGFGESDYRESGLDIEADIPQTYEQSIQTERSFLAENGRINNDFNNIDQFAGKESIMGELNEQYIKSPTMLSGQLFQIQEIEGVVTEIPDHLRLLDGESYEDYTARLSDVLHRDAGLHDLLTDYTVDYIGDRFSLVDMPSVYESASIDDSANSHWDSHVISSDPNDWFIPLGEDGSGVRVKCGQPAKIDPTVSVPQGYGGAPVPAPEYTPTPNNPITPGTPGEGGPPPVVEVPPIDNPPIDNPLIDNPLIDNPPVDNPPIEQPPVELKNFNLNPELEGLVQLPLNESITPRTEAPTVGDNGTKLPDFTPGAEGSTPGSDTGPTVSVPEAQTPTIDVSGNAPETGANQTDSAGNSTPNGTFKDNL